MKHLTPAWFAIAILVPFLALPSAAPAANFDQGHYEGVSPLLLTPMKALPADLPAQTRVLKMFHTRLETYLSKNAAYAQMTAILRDPRMEGISAEGRRDCRSSTPFGRVLPHLNERSGMRR